MKRYRFCIYSLEVNPIGVDVAHQVLADWWDVVDEEGADFAPSDFSSMQDFADSGVLRSTLYGVNMACVCTKICDFLDSYGTIISELDITCYGQDDSIVRFFAEFDDDGLPYLMVGKGSMKYGSHLYD